MVYQKGVRIMRFIIYGAGGIGGVIGGHLARSGHDVVLIGRPGNVKAITRTGCALSHQPAPTFCRYRLLPDRSR